MKHCSFIMIVAFSVVAPSDRLIAQSPAQSVPELLQALRNDIAQLQPRRYYLTRDSFDGSQAVYACAPGFHMANLMEILDPTTLRYDSTLGHTEPDAGSGPPTENGGWIRTGRFAKAAGSGANCNAWTSASPLECGTQVELTQDWSDPASDGGPWDADNTASCSWTLRTWCVQD